jgi:hypothetical protein
MDVAQPLARVAIGAPWGGPGIPAAVEVAQPFDRALLGRPLYLQGQLVERASGAPPRIVLTDGVRLTLGP